MVSLLYGLHAPDEGRILLEGREVRIPSPKAARRLGIALVPQHPELVEALTVGENLALGLDLPFWLGDLRKVLEGPLGALGVGLGVDLRARVESLSLGERQRVVLLQALLARPKVLILDEPTAVLTPKEAEALFQEVDRLRARGLAVVFITHRLEEVFRVADRVAVLRGGRKVGEFARGEVDRDTLVELMVGQRPLPLPRAKPPKEEVVLQVEGLEVDRHGFPLKGVGFTLRAGEILGVAGVAGSGERELVEALAGLRPYRGQVLLLGAPLPKDPAALYPLGVAHIPESRHQGVAPGLSLAENLALRDQAFSPALALLDLRALEARARELMARYRIQAPSPKAPVRLLSGGNLQKVILARELGGRPRLVLAMHPTYGLDAGAREEVHRLLLDLAGEGVAILLVSEDLEEILALAHRVAALHRGRLVGPYPRGEVDFLRLGRMMAEGRA